MFTGLIEEIGTCQWIRKTSQGGHLAIFAPQIEASLHVGESVAVNGCCLTVVEHHGGCIQFDLLEETLQRSNLGKLEIGMMVNLERALPADGRVGGHFVQGHVDVTATVLCVAESGSDLRLDFKMPPEFARYIALKGSIAINGVSLTVAECVSESFAVWIIPHTRQHTTFDELTIGDEVNIECDILAKYVERIIDVKK